MALILFRISRLVALHRPPDGSCSCLVLALFNTSEKRLTRAVLLRFAKAPQVWYRWIQQSLHAIQGFIRVGLPIAYRFLQLYGVCQVQRSLFAILGSTEASMLNVLAQPSSQESLSHHAWTCGCILNVSI